MTLIEIVVVAAMISLLMALLLVGVMAARGAARRMSCENNLRQLGIAMTQYESTYLVFPAGHMNGKSVLFSVMPQLGYATDYEKYEKTILRSIEVAFPGEGSSVYFPRMCDFDRRRFAEFECPDDPVIHHTTPDGGGSSYSGNSGVWGAIEWDGVFVLNPSTVTNGVRAAEILDGKSETILLAEQRTDEWGQGQRLSTIWYPDVHFTASEMELARKYCENLPEDPKAAGFSAGHPRGRPWPWGQMGVTLYNHVCTPNQPSISGTYLGEETGDLGFVSTTTIATAGSHHPKGCNVVYVDGHVEFVSDGIDLQVWRMKGKRND